jgi:drug/metabolite transporter superfamily protein YnfA
VTGLFAYAGFTGCFLSCSTPEPGTGLLWSAVGAVLLALPLVLGMTAAGVRSRAAWWSAAAFVVLAVVGWDLAAVLA